MKSEIEIKKIYENVRNRYAYADMNHWDDFDYNQTFFVSLGLKVDMLENILEIPENERYRFSSEEVKRQWSKEGKQ